MSCISNEDLLPRQFQVQFWELRRGIPIAGEEDTFISSVYVVAYFEKY
jgi:hypothetical protein